MNARNRNRGRNRRDKNRSGAAGPKGKPQQITQKGSIQNKTSPQTQQGQNASEQQKGAPVKYTVTALKLAPKSYGIIFFDSFDEAKQNVAKLSEEKAKVDQLNICILAEGNMDDPELMAYGKVYAGAAWTLIHRRRVAEGYYKAPQPSRNVLPIVYVDPDAEPTSSTKG